MDVLKIILSCFDVALLICMTFVYFSQNYCSKISLTFINIIPPAALAMATLFGFIFPYIPAVVFAAYISGCFFFYSGNLLLKKKGRSPVPVYPSGLIVLLSIPVWAAVVGTIGLYTLLQTGYAH